MSVPTDRIKSAYLGLFIAAFVAALYMSNVKPEHEEWSSNPAYALSIEAREKADLRSYGRCLGDAAHDDDLARLTVALTAVENLARPRWQRAVEISVARLWLLVAGRLPNFSLGIGQVRVSTAKRLLKEAGNEPNDHDLADLLQNDCGCIKLAYRYVQSLSGQQACQVHTAVSRDFLEEWRLTKLPGKQVAEILRDRFKWTGSLESKRIPWDSCGRLIVEEYNGQSLDRALGRGYWEGLYEEVVQHVFFSLRPKSVEGSVTK